MISKKPKRKTRATMLRVTAAYQKACLCDITRKSVSLRLDEESLAKEEKPEIQSKHEIFLLRRKNTEVNEYPSHQASVEDDDIRVDDM